MKLVNAEEMRAIDACAIEKHKIASLELMANAGQAIFEYLDENILFDQKAALITILCGLGNNGGDGFVVGQKLIEAGYNIQFFLCGNDEKLSDDCRANYDKVVKAGSDLEIISDDATSDFPDLTESDFIIDAIFGTGFSGAPRGISLPIIEAINDSDAVVISIDAPSGLDVSTGQSAGAVVQADYTISLALPKPGLFISPGRELAGAVAVVPIGIPDEAVASFDLTADLITGETVSFLLPQPIPDGHKGDFGKVLIIAGSPGLTGAAALSGLASARSGAGLVTVGTPASLNPILESKLTEVMTTPLPEVKKRSVLALRGRGEIRKLLVDKNAVAIGPGLGRHHETGELVKRLVGDLTIPAVIDADGLYPLSGDDSPLCSDHAPLILTPHPGEFARLTGVTPDENPVNNYDLLTRFAKKFNSVIILKGSPTLIGSPDGAVFLNPTGNYGMATGGSGDVLTGILVTLLGQGLSTIEAAICSVFIHGLSADLAIGSGDINPRSLIAGDIIDYLSPAFDALEIDE